MVSRTSKHRMREILIATSGVGRRNMRIRKIMTTFMQIHKFSTVPEVSGIAFSAELDNTEFLAIRVFKYLWKHFAQGLGRLGVFVV